MRLATLAATLATLVLATPAHAVPVLQFAQISGGNTITGTASGGSSTTITGTDVAVGVTQDLGGFLGTAFLDLSATSIDAAVGLGNVVLQHFTGSFAVTTLPVGGVNILSGTFTDAALGVGPALSLSIGSPPDSLALSSDIIAPANLVSPLALAFSLTNVSPSIHLDGATLASFTSTAAGNVSASAVEVPDGAPSLALLGVGLFGLGLVRRARTH